MAWMSAGGRSWALSLCLAAVIVGCKQKQGQETRGIEPGTEITSTAAKGEELSAPVQEKSVEGEKSGPGSGYDEPLEIRKPSLCDGCAGSDVCSPCVVSWHRTSASSPYLDVVVRDGTAYVAAGRSGVLLFDLSGDEPKRGAKGKTAGFARKLYLDGDVLYMASMDAGLEVFSVAKPGSVKRLGAVETPGRAWDVWVSDGHAFVADADGGLQVIDVSKPASPMLVASLDTPGVASAVVVSGGVAFVADGYNYDGCEGQVKLGCNLRVIDVSDPSRPTQVNVVDVGGIEELALDGRTLFATGWDTLFEFDVDDPVKPALTRVATTDCFGWETTNEQILTRHGAGVSERSSPTFLGITVTDALVLADGLVFDRRTMKAIAAVPTPAGTPHAGQIEDDRYIVADGEGGLVVIDLGDPAYPSFVDVMPIPGLCLAMDGTGSHALIVSREMEDDEGRVLFFELNEDGRACLLWQEELGFVGGDAGVHIDGDRAWVTIAGEHEIEVRAYDISTPEKHHVAGSIGLGIQYLPGKILLEGGKAFVSVEDWTGSKPVRYVRIIDVSDVASPKKLSMFRVKNEVKDLLLLGSHLFVAEGQDKGIVEIVDVSDATKPVVVKDLRFNALVTSLEHAGGHLVVALDAGVTEKGGIKIFDVSDPTAPVRVGPKTLRDGIPDSDSNHGDVQVVGDLLYATTVDRGLAVYDVSSPPGSHFVASAVWPHPSCLYLYGERDYLLLHVAGDHAYVCGQNAGFEGELYTVALRPGPDSSKKPPGDVKCAPPQVFQKDDEEEVECARPY